MNRGPDDSVARLVALMLRWPMDALVAGMNVFVNGMEEFETVLTESRRSSDIRSSVAAALASPDPVPGWLPGDGPAQPAGEPGVAFPVFTRREERPMAVDLGGDDIKNVSYWISFVKPDFVTTLQPMTEETIDYPTDEASFGGLKLARFFERFSQGGIPWPTGWSRRPGPEYPTVGQLLRSIPTKDEKYIKFNLRLNWRQPLPDAEREKDKVDVLREIRDALT